MERWRPLKPVRIICIAQSPKTFYNFTLWWRHNFWNSFSRLSESFSHIKPPLIIKSSNHYQLLFAVLCVLSTVLQTFFAAKLWVDTRPDERKTALCPPCPELNLWLKSPSCLSASLLWTSNVKIIVWLTALVKVVLVLDYSPSKS